MFKYVTDSYSYNSLVSVTLNPLHQTFSHSSSAKLPFSTLTTCILSLYPLHLFFNDNLVCMQCERWDSGLFHWGGVFLEEGGLGGGGGGDNGTQLEHKEQQE